MIFFGPSRFGLVFLAAFFLLPLFLYAPGVALLVGGADYDAKDFGVDSRKLWVQAQYGF